MIAQALKAFAQEHTLPLPIERSGPDGEHLFVFSGDQSRRYAYCLTWDEAKPHLLWIMLNPGTGESEGRRRNTFERCKTWSHALGFGGMMFGNVFAVRSKSAKDLIAVSPAPENLNTKALTLLSSLASATIVAWGNHGSRSDQPAALRSLLVGAKCFGLTKSGQPRHPLYVSASTPLVAW